MASTLSVSTHQRGSTLQLNVSSAIFYNASAQLATQSINVNDVALAIIKITKDKPDSEEIVVSLKMKRKEDAQKCTVNITSENVSHLCFLSEVWIEILLHTIVNGKKIWANYYNGYNSDNKLTTLLYATEVNITVLEETFTPLFVNKQLYEDAESTDFQLTAADGSVPVHKAVLFIHSDMFRTMFRGEWKETTEGQIKVDGVTVQTLQHLKDYMYLGTLPDEGLEPLLLLAARYFIDKLKKDCVSKLIKTIEPENFDNIVELAAQNNIVELVRALIMDVPDDIINKVHQLKLGHMTMGRSCDKRKGKMVQVSYRVVSKGRTEKERQTTKEMGR